MLDALRNVIKRGLVGLVAGLHRERDLGVLDVVGDDLAELGEVPAVPLARAHRVLIEFLVEVVEQGDCLDDHLVDLVGGVAQLEAVHIVREAMRRLVHLLLRHGLEDRVNVLADAAHDADRLLAVDDRDAELFFYNFAELEVRDGEGLDALREVVFKNFLSGLERSDWTSATVESTASFEDLNLSRECSAGVSPWTRTMAKPAGTSVSA